MKLEIKKSTIIAFLLYQSIFINLSYINGYGALKYLGLIIVTIFLIFNIDIFFKKKYLRVNMILIILFITMIILTIYNMEFYEKSFLTGIFNALNILDIYLFFEYLGYKEKVKQGINIFYKLTLFYVLVNDIVMLLIPKFFQINHTYLIGNKFEVSYLHIFLLILFYQLNINDINKSIGKKMKFLFISILAIAVSISVQCNTALIGCVIVIIFTLLGKVLKKILINNNIMIIFLVISDSILLIGSSILSNPIIKYFIVNILGEDITLTGRMRIYNQIFPIINERFWVGYGYENNYSVLYKKIYAPNTQNGVLECIFLYGIISTVLILILMYLSMKNARNNVIMYPIIIIIYMYILLSSVEITLGITILPFFAIINAQSKEEW